jgi:PAS domain S-box-containing protein
MTKTIQLQTTLYEIAMHIGTSREPKILAKDAIASFVRQLNCSGAILCQKNKISPHHEPYYTTPKNLFSQEKTKSFLAIFCQELQDTTDEEMSKPYSTKEFEGVYYHIFSLENFGKLILLRNTHPFSLTLTKALLPVCKKFSNALCTSMEAEQKTKELINFKTLIDTISEGLALFDEDLTCIEINQSALDKFGYTYQEALGKHIFTVISKEDHVKLQYLNRQEHAQSEWTLLKKDGDTFPAFVSGSDIIYKEKAARIVTFLDLTEIKAKEKQLYNQSRLAQMGEMISMIAHQWRQPLGAISASTIGIKTKIQMKKFDLRTEDGREEQERYLMKKLDNISTYVDHLSNTIEDFRNFFKPNKEKTSVNLKQVINKALDILHPAIIDKHITISKDITFQHSIEAYHNEILQALLNILKNAIDNFEVQHIQNPKISISGYEEDGKSIIMITDNGGGIPIEILDKIFNPYFSTKDDKNGTGLGLYMTKTMIEDHCKGVLSVKNIQDGARFKITLT